MADSQRSCACGCGRALNGQASQKYASEACRKRAARAAQSRPEPPVTVAAGKGGEMLPALDRWLAEQDEELPPPLVAAARALSAQVDLAPKSSPLWGRLTTVLTELLEPALEARAWHVTQRQAIQQVAIAGRDDAWRAAMYREARDAGMDPTPWEKVVPIGCVQGRHHWRGGQHQRQVCRYCGEWRTEEP